MEIIALFRGNCYTFWPGCYLKESEWTPHFNGAIAALWS